MRNIWIVAVSATALALGACDGNDQPQVPAGDPSNDAAPLNEFQQARLEGLENIAEAAPPPANPATIEPSAIEPYAAGSYPDTVRKFGKAISAVNADRKAAAKIAAADPRCNGVSNAQVSTRSPMVNRRYWVECGNLTRFRFDEASLAKGEPVSVQTVKDMARDGLITD